MLERLGEWWWNTPTQQWQWALGGVFLVLVAAHLAKRSIEKHVANIDARYRTRKFVSLASYLIAGIVVVNVFQERLGSFTVFVGMAGAGIAFALQEVIASVAGWVAISFGGFYSPGDRVQVGGIKGESRWQAISIRAG